MSAHAVLAPSSAPIWGFCSGSVTAQLSAPNVETQESKEGTAAHWVGGECLERWNTADALDLHCADWVGRVAPNGVVIDDKMAEGAQVYVDDVLAIAHKHHALGRMWVERRVSMPRIHAQNWGTLDLCLPLVAQGVIYLWDYKHGHREVAAKGNLQFVDYLEGVAQELGVNVFENLQIEFVIRVVQPFAYRANGPVSEWRGSLSELRGYIAQLTHQAEQALTHPTFTAGKHCRDCRAVGSCATAKRYEYAFLDYVNEPYVIDNMQSADLATEREILRSGLAVGKARLEAIETELEHRVGSGDAGSGLTLEAVQSNRWYWGVGPAQAIALCAQFDIDARKDDAITPKQALSKVDPSLRQTFNKVLKTVIQPPKTSTKLIPADESLTSRAFKQR